MKLINSTEWLDELKSDDKVLLINPPVFEVRYAWARWNQPTDLLLLSNKLKREVRCEVQLIDFMLPTDTGRIPISESGRQKEVKGYKKRRYGVAFEEVRSNLLNIMNTWKPTHIVITSLTSYWYEGIISLVSPLRTTLENCSITVMGSYPIIETNHAKRTFADFLIIDNFDFKDYIPDFEIYFEPITKSLNTNKTISFGGLIYTKNNTVENLMKQVETLKQRQIKNCVVFDDDLFKEDCLIMDDFLTSLEKQGWSINLQGLCGLNICNAKVGIFEKMLKGGYRSFFLEYDLVDNELNIDNYLRMYNELCVDPIRPIVSGQLAGFIMIGRPDDDIEKLFRHSLSLLEICGSIIPKPYTANVNSREYEILSKENIDYLSPHVFPFSEMSGISREEYVEFYQHITFLNEKRMGKSFNYFDVSHSTIALKNSLGKKGGKEIG
jgi:hypothetical protein